MSHVWMLICEPIIYQKYFHKFHNKCMLNVTTSLIFMCLFHVCFWFFQTAINHVSISRPYLHWTTLWLLLCGLLSLFHHNLAVLVLTSVLSHHLRDAARRGLSFYPLFSTPPIPSVLYLGLILTLPVISSYCFQSQVNKFYPKDVFLA